MARILIVDDEIVIRELVRESLEDCGYEVAIARDAREALSFLARPGSRTFDLIITDIVMPEISGLELIRTLRRTYPEIRVLAISGGRSLKGAEEREVLSLAKAIGAAGILRKPFGFRRLRRVVREQLEEREAKAGPLVTAGDSAPVSVSMSELDPLLRE